MPASTSSSTSSRSATNGGTGSNDGGAALPQDTTRSIHTNITSAVSDTDSRVGPAAAPLTAENLATHGASGVAVTPSGSTASSTTTTFAFFSGLNEDDFNRRLDELRINRQAGLARLEADARAAQGHTRGASRRSASLPSPADTDPSSTSDNSGTDTSSESSSTPPGSSDTPSQSSDGDGGSTTTSTPSSTTEATEHGDTISQKLVKYLLGETNGMDVRNRRGWQELCLASGAAVGNNPFVCGEVRNITSTF